MLLPVPRPTTRPKGVSENYLGTVPILAERKWDCPLPGVGSCFFAAPKRLARWDAMLGRNASKTLDRSTEGGKTVRRVRGTPTAAPEGLLRTIGGELKAHAPFTTVGAITGLAIMVILVSAEAPRSFSTTLFWGLHPLHVLLSALVTAGMYRLHGTGKLWATILVGYLGSIGIATLSDCVIPYLGESLLGLPNRGIHFGFIEKWWLVNPLALIGIAIGYWWPKTKFPHAGHVLLSTWASLFHMAMALGHQLDLLTMAVVLLFLFLAVWIPCCTSDIVFPLLFSSDARRSRPG